MNAKRIFLAGLLALGLATQAIAGDCVLRQSDAVEVTLGPYVDSTDGITAETGLTISQGDVILKKCAAGGDCAASAQKNDSSACAHDANGMYECDFDATDTNTVGILEIWSLESGAGPVFKTCLVVEEAVYDRDYAASALGYVANAPVNTVQFSGDTTAADNLEAWMDGTAGAVPYTGIVDRGTLQAVDGDSAQLRDAAAFGDNVLNGATIVITSGTYAGLRGLITDYAETGDAATVTWSGSVTPSGTPTYEVWGTTESSGGGGLDAAGIRAALGMASANLDTQLAGLDGKLDTIDNLIDTEIGAIISALTTIDDFIDTEIAAIKAKTDQLTFSIANTLNANTKYMNDAQVCGDGSDGDPWADCP